MYKVPDELQISVNKMLSGASLERLTEQSKELSARYRSSQKPLQAFMTEETHRMAYLACRMPATYAVLCRVLEEVLRLLPDLEIASAADMGAGPGTAAWAIAHFFPEIEKIDLYEKDLALIKIGKHLMSESPQGAFKQANWQCKDLSQSVELISSDLCLFSYFLGEIGESKRESLLLNAWNAVSKVLMIIEPGTPAGFEKIRRFRALLIQNGASIIAPCPHQLSCPMPKNDWCHFSERLERSSIHRSLKTASLGYEDEKYSYVAAIKKDQTTPLSYAMRILRHPIKHSGHLDLTVCSKHGIEQVKFSRKEGELYKKARKLEWGDCMC